MLINYPGLNSLLLLAAFFFQVEWWTLQAAQKMAVCGLCYWIMTCAVPVLSPEWPIMWFDSSIYFINPLPSPISPCCNIFKIMYTVYKFSMLPSTTPSTLMIINCIMYNYIHFLLQSLDRRTLALEESLQTDKIIGKYGNMCTIYATFIKMFILLQFMY